MSLWIPWDYVVVYILMNKKFMLKAIPVRFSDDGEMKKAKATLMGSTNRWRRVQI